MSERLTRQAFLRVATVVALSRDFPSGPIFDRHVAHMADLVPRLPDQPDDPLYVLRQCASALVDGRLSSARPDWSTLVYDLQRALRDCMVVAAAQALESIDAHAGR